VRAAWSAARPGRHDFDTACVAPWVSLEFDPAGYVYGCCSSHLYPLGRIGVDRLTDLWNGERSQALRSALADWDLTVACGSCRWHLEHGRHDPVAAVYDRYPAVEFPGSPHMMLFALSNRCNLACVMCNGELSSRIRANEGRAPLESPYDDAFFEDLAPLLADLRLAKFLGGEPFLAPEHHRVWDLMALQPGRPRLDITTNGTVWTDRVERLLDEFEVDISISVDAATAATYQDVRGGDFEQLRANLERFRGEATRRGTGFHVSYCLMSRNAHELMPFLQWADELGTEASINLVTDDGLALHDLDTEHLVEVHRAWQRQAADARLHLNEHVWLTQVDQLESVLAERGGSGLTQPRQSRPVPEGFFDQGPDAPDARGESRIDHLRRWAGGDDVAVIDLAPDRTVAAVRAGHDHLGIDKTFEGAPIGTLVDVMGAALGATAWSVDYDVAATHVVRVLVMSAAKPGRGSSGTVVRTVEFATPSGSTVLVAADRMFEDVAVRSRPVTLEAGRRRSDPPPSGS
jgi:MoaA/NifB/PqqE/SkfB family radical SAM enzyme